MRVVVGAEEEACWWKRGWCYMAKGQRHCRETKDGNCKEHRINKSAMVVPNTSLIKCLMLIKSLILIKCLMVY